MTDDLRPSRTVALFPFALGTESPSAQQADLCRGIAFYLERRLGRLPGIQPLLQNLLAVSGTEPGPRGWVVASSMWSVDQVMAFPFPAELGVTHVVQGIARWTDDELEATVEVIDLATGESAYRNDTAGPPAESLPRLHAMLADATLAITGWESAARLVARPPTADPAAMREYLLALAWIQSIQRGMSGPAPAFSYLERALGRDADFLEAASTLEWLGELCLARGEHPAETDAALERALELGLATPRLRLLHGMRLATLGDPRARAVLEAALTEQPRGETASRAFLALRALLLAQGDAVNAARAAGSAVAAHEGNPEAWEILATHHDADGRPRKAEDCLRQALQIDPDRPATLVALAHRLVARGDKLGALALLARAHRLPGTPAEARLLLLDIHLQLNRLEEGNEYATALTEENGDDAALWLRLGEMRRRLGDRDAARHCVNRLRALGAEGDAFRWLALAVEHPADAEEVEGAEGLLAARVGPAPLAHSAQAMARVAQRHPAEPRVWRALAALHRATGDRAAEVASRAHLVRILPCDAAALDDLSAAHAALGSALSAADTLRAAIALQPTGTRWERLGALLLDSGDSPAARDAWQQALALDPARRDLRRRLEKLAMQQLPPAPASREPRAAGPPPPAWRRMLARLWPRR